MTTPLFSVNNLNCSYDGAESVLIINKLEIPRGKLIAILGASGAGKSTILETLGLMNKTFINGTSITFNDGNGSEFSLETLWNDNKIQEIEEIRKKHFSFIFQETNLMQNFTAYENVCLSQMLQGTSFKEAMHSAKNNMQKVGLSEIDQVKKAHELSGGQKQRLAFVRAVTPQYSVLFGDEPTGNLDEKTSRDLWSIIREEVNTKGVTAIIVTHNINLSVQFADLILLITKAGSYGELNADSVFHGIQQQKDQKIWFDSAHCEVKDIEKSIRELL
ncbi:MAG: ABC transporter ATP-binding protein [Bacteroidales bacterium]|nr:ABC transporter ATP-binding protein [Bacteroidales bacterium]